MGKEWEKAWGSGGLDVLGSGGRGEIWRRVGRGAFGVGLEVNLRGSIF